MRIIIRTRTTSAAASRLAEGTPRTSAVARRVGVPSAVSAATAVASPAARRSAFVWAQLDDQVEQAWRAARA